MTAKLCPTCGGYGDLAAGEQQSTQDAPSPVEVEAARVFEEMHDCIRAPFWRRQPTRRFFPNTEEGHREAVEALRHG